MDIFTSKEFDLNTIFYSLSIFLNGDKKKQFVVANWIERTVALR